MTRPHHDCSELLEANLGVIGARCPSAAEAIRRASAAAVRIERAADGGLTGTVEEGGVVRRLCSARSPREEGRRLAASVDTAASAVVVVNGLGLGHHVAALGERLKRTGAVIVFEPDVGLLRAVLERLDLGAIARTTNLAVLTDPDDTGAVAGAVSGIEALLASGTTIVDHPPSRARLGERSERFGRSFATVMKAVRTSVVTTLVQVDVTVRNLLQNVGWYATVPGVEDLAGVQRGRPAVVVSAGPSLRRNIEVLAREGVRDRVVIIAVQTVLKTLLARGIRPHFVTALDYHEISARFYEGLTAEDVRGVTLVAEPKANPAILRAFPGAIRCPGDKVLDEVLGPGLSREHGTITPGATVAHLAYYLARFMGCDPVILVGQDLGFTDGQYYAPGAAIHRVWSGELNEFNTLEMLEWQRIARMKSLLRRATDVRGRAIFTDEQMSTYLVQFEREFLADSRRGLTTIDATEGGVRKQHTRVMTLEEALARHATGAPGAAPGCERVEPASRPDVLAKVESRLEELRRSAGRVGVASREAAGVLEEMLARQDDRARVDRLIGRVNEIGARATAEGAYWLVQHVNQAGQLNRFKADRAIELDGGAAPLERQRREIERDLANVRWLAEASELIAGMLDGALEATRGGAPVTRDPAPPEVEVRREPRRVWACVRVDASRGGLGVERPLAAPLVLGLNPLRLTLRRLAGCRRIEGVLLVCADEGLARSLAGEVPAGLRVEFERGRGGSEKRRSAVAIGRRWARHCWRGGIANLTCFDETFDPGELAATLAARGFDAALVLGADWCLVDPALADAAVERHLERPSGHPVTFTQAPPGLAPALLSRSVAEELARARGAWASVGGLLGYVPTAPQGDPIAKPVCVPVAPEVRDLLVRCVPDTPRQAARLAAALRPLGEGVLTADAPTIARALAPLALSGPVEFVEADLDEGWDPLELEDALAAAGSSCDAPCLTLRASGATPGPWVAAAAAWAKSHGFAGVHVRLPAEAVGIAEVVAGPGFGVDVVSVDLRADTPGTFAALGGRGDLDALRERWWRLAGRCGAEGMPVPWIVPRITRRDEVMEEIETFVDRWLLATGVAVVDPGPGGAGGSRIEALPAPENVMRRRAWASRRVTARGVGAGVEPKAGAPADWSAL